jgi:hypothetical protein
MLHFLTLPKAAWNGTLYKCRLKIELVTEWDLHVDIERGLRGGLCMPFQPHALANDPATPEYDPNQDPAVIAYWDANSLYPSQMLNYLPVGGFRAEEHANHTAYLYELIDSFNPENPKGYLICADMYVPAHQHDKLDWGPIRKGPTHSGGPDKLYSYLGPQEGYMLTLPLAHCYHTILGVRFQKVHRIWSYDQAPYLRDHILEMAARRAEAKSDILKDTYKKCTNSIYGCTVENMEKRTSVVTYTDMFEFEQAVAKNWTPGMKVDVRYHYPNGDFLAHRERRPRGGVVLRSPRLVGVAILDYARVHMYRFHYGFVKLNFGNDARLLYTDTDSVIVRIANVRSVHEAMQRDPSWFDFSNGRKFGWTEAPENSGKAGPFKFELVNKDTGELQHALEYAASEAKCYGMRLWNDKDYLRCKGNPRDVVKKHIQFEKVKKAALNQELVRTSFNRIQMKNSEARHVGIDKVAMRGNNTKVYALDKENFLPLGHRDAKIDEGCKILHRLMLRRAFEAWKHAAAENKPNDSSQ